LLKFTIRDAADTYIVATEPGIIHQMRKANPSKNYLAAPPKDSTCGCNDCIYMKLITIRKLYNCMKYELPEVKVEERLLQKAKTSIERMLEISSKLRL
jgi:quinolinate synthase